MLQRKILSLGALGLALAVPAAWADTTNTARPGTLNYVEGQVRAGSKALGATDMGHAELAPGETIQTGAGKAEILLTPGTFLRLGSNSSARMISPGLTDTRIQVESGKAMVEATALSKNSDVRIGQNGAFTRVLKDGVYEFNADGGNVRVFDGKAEVIQDDRKLELKGGREAQLATAPLKAEKFDRKASEDELYRWSSARSEYLADANAASVRAYVVNPSASAFYGNGWYWNPWFRTWSFMPSTGLFYSPFGYSFYSPRYFYSPRPVFVAPRRPVVIRQAAPALRAAPSTPMSRGMYRRGR